MNENFADILAAIKERGMHLAAAESLTGGLLSSTIVDVPGSSQVYLGGVVAYQDEVKANELNVSEQTLATEGAVSESAAREMAVGTLVKFAAACDIAFEKVIGVATTGVAGPDADGEHPAGQVFIAAAMGGEVIVRELALAGSRREIREATVVEVAKLLRSLLA